MATPKLIEVILLFITSTNLLINALPYWASIPIGITLLALLLRNHSSVFRKYVEWHIRELLNLQGHIEWWE